MNSSQLPEKLSQGPLVIHVDTEARYGNWQYWYHKLFSSVTFVYFLVHANITVRYKQSLFGLVWVFIAPFAEVVVWVFLFQYVAKVPSWKIPYILVVFSGNIVWRSFFEGFMKGVSICKDNASLLGGVHVSKTLLILVNIFTVYFDVCLIMLVYGACLFFYDFAGSVLLLLVPFLLFALTSMSVMIGLLFSYIQAMYRDVAFFLQNFLQIFRYASPIVYTVSRIPEDLLFWYSLNPLVSIVTVLRYWSTGVYDVMRWDAALISWVVMLFVCATGVFVYFRQVKSVIDVL